ncbi:MAG: pyruvate, phosphate dikinase [Armatimonadetes bacterium]|nr:pyruvate, phosphate dikinase [Armatimonadota bacterium]
MPEKRVYLFREGAADQRDLLGGKGANLCEMTNIGLPVPPGFTITTDVCREFYEEGERLPEGLMSDVRAAMSDVERDLDKKLGGSGQGMPLLVSVRSGSKFSMPGMMDTILNLGLNEETLQGLIAASGDARFAWDSYRRFIMMFSDVVLGVSKHRFDDVFRAYKEEKGAKLDTDLSAEDLKHISGVFLSMVDNFPTDPWKQLELAIDAVFRSWNNERAIVYRRSEKIPDDIGTAVTVQAMVFGNMGEDCGTGVAFTRDPSTGEKALYGEYLMNAQGEDVVAGVRTPVPISHMATQNPAVYKEFIGICDALESHYKDMMDVEFTVEKGRLFMLQCRAGKRTGPAAVRAAVEMVAERLIGKEMAIQRVTASHLDQLLHPRIDEKSLGSGPIATGLAASPGAAVGKAVFDSDTAAKLGAEGEKVVLIRDETNPDDVHGMLASQGILTARGGKTSHAAVVARGFGIPCVAGCEAINVDERNRRLTVDGVTIQEGELISLDGSTGKVYAGEVALIAPEVSGHFGELMAWCDEARRLGVRANADNPRDAEQAIEFGAEGIGLCRTEHMFFERDRLPVVQQMILAKDESVRQGALDQLLIHQQHDFEGIFEVMDGKPVTIRLIDPPLHEFLPSYDELLVQVTELRVTARHDPGHDMADAIEAKEELLLAVEGMREANPMLGLRGVRLSILFPGIVEMQTKAILQAAVEVKKRGIDPQPEIMIPLVGHVNELKVVREQLEKVAETVLAHSGHQISYKFGTMIEIPRAALTAKEIAQYAEFFSFGTNDLTQTTFGYSRDDAEGKFLGKYVEDKILPVNPFETIDFDGVGKLMRMCVEDGRSVNPVLKLGICGEHGGDPESIYFCHDLGLDYVSCSPFRVPIARLAAAQAAVKDKVKVVVDR